MILLAEEKHDITRLVPFGLHAPVFVYKGQILDFFRVYTIFIQHGEELGMRLDYFILSHSVIFSYLHQQKYKILPT